MSKQEFPRTLFHFILYFFKPYIWYLFCLILIALLWAANTSLGPYLVKMILDILENTPHESTSLLFDLKKPILFYIILRIFITIINRFHDYISLKVLPRFNKDVLICVTKYVQKHSHSYFQHHFGGSLVSKLSIIADTTESILHNLIYNFIFPFFTLCVVAITMGTVSPFLAIILILWIIIFIMVSYHLSFQVQTLAEEFSEKYTNLIGKLIDSVTNIMAVRLFARRKYEIRTLESTAQEKVRAAEELKWNDLKRNAAMEMMSNILICILIYFLIRERQKGNISIGDFSLVFILAISIIDIIWDVSRDYIRFIESWGKCSQALKTIMAPHEVKDIPKALPLIVQDGTIEFKEVCFGFQEQSSLFQNLSIVIKENEKVGIVGESGSGKTTFLNLIVRLWDVNSGSILIDQQDIKKVTQDSLHQNISFIPQDPLLFHRTILENIKYGNLEASEEEITEAARKAHADGFIKALPQGFNTLIGERGAMISGGQRQRLAIARAILKGAKILILDEATSALDSETEHYIQESLEVLMHNKTVLVAAHRLSTLLKMDRIIVFQDGKIIEEGDHTSLLQKRKVYAKFWNRQTLSSFS